MNIEWLLNVNPGSAGFNCHIIHMGCNSSRGSMVEPVAGVPGAYPVLLIKPLLPYALSFAAGAMIFVVAEELVPESQSGNESDLSTIGALLGFSIMMFLDAALG